VVLISNLLFDRGKSSLQCCQTPLLLMLLERIQDLENNLLGLGNLGFCLLLPEFQEFKYRIDLAIKINPDGIELPGRDPVLDQVIILERGCSFLSTSHISVESPLHMIIVAGIASKERFLLRIQDQPTLVCGGVITQVIVPLQRP
jgi:hypothetical protein